MGEQTGYTMARATPCLFFYFLFLKCMFLQCVCLCVYVCVFVCVCRYKSTSIEPWSGRGTAVGVASADCMREEHQQIMEEQDKGLEHLSQGIRRQKKMGLAMQDEIKEQNGTAMIMVVV